MIPPDTRATPTLRQQIDSLPIHIMGVWRSRYANEGTDLEARAIIDREAATIRASGATADAGAAARVGCRHRPRGAGRRHTHAGV